ncbi:hypothetical protein Q664_06145 [Archangium violaceum Cb vi76]|uniref:Uncharacterized protein n=1 Tax=Archangium violaceum Cb vi76 TaxID=1406225 RepID=A0A084SZP8_9BACT|nr:hypothetical protein Q664_06145 [Archangium violaceum Cb vi76]
MGEVLEPLKVAPGQGEVLLEVERIQEVEVLLHGLQPMQELLPLSFHGLVGAMLPVHPIRLSFEPDAVAGDMPRQLGAQPPLAQEVLGCDEDKVERAAQPTGPRAYAQQVEVRVLVGHPRRA